MKKLCTYLTLFVLSLLCFAQPAAAADYTFYCDVSDAGWSDCWIYTFNKEKFNWTNMDGKCTHGEKLSDGVYKFVIKDQNSKGNILFTNKDVSNGWDGASQTDDIKGDAVVNNRLYKRNSNNNGYTTNDSYTEPVQITANPAPGTYSEAQNVGFSTNLTLGQYQIFYTTDGSTPTKASSILDPGATIKVASSMTIKAKIAPQANGWNLLDEVFEFSYTIQGSTPAGNLYITGGFGPWGTWHEMDKDASGNYYYTFNAQEFKISGQKSYENDAYHVTDNKVGLNEPASNNFIEGKVDDNISFPSGVSGEVTLHVSADRTKIWYTTGNEPDPVVSLTADPASGETRTAAFDVTFTLNNAPTGVKFLRYSTTGHHDAVGEYENYVQFDDNNTAKITISQTVTIYARVFYNGTNTF